jgi:hypothetical protein
MFLVLYKKELTSVINDDIWGHGVFVIDNYVPLSVCIYQNHCVLYILQQTYKTKQPLVQQLSTLWYGLKKHDYLKFYI